MARRLVCDHAGLTTTQWCEHVVSIEALKWFARTAKDSRGRRRTGRRSGANARREAAGLGPRCRYVERRVRVREGVGTARIATRVCHGMQGGAGSVGATGVDVVEVAEVTGHNPTAVAQALSACGSTRRTGPGMWTAVAPRRFEDPAEVVRVCSDDAGVIDEAALAQAAALRNWDPTQLARVVGMCAVVRTSRHGRHPHSTSQSSPVEP